MQKTAPLRLPDIGLNPSESNKFDPIKQDDLEISKYGIQNKCQVFAMEEAITYHV
ncbi:MAG: hypothetical protein ACREQP_13900 [Candidatus Binatia bacterium]